MIIAELVTLLGFTVNQSGAAQFNNMLTQMQVRANAFSAGIGATLGNKLVNFAFEIKDQFEAALAGIPKSGDEMNSAIQKIKSSLGDSAIAGGEAVAIYEKLYSTSLITGIGANDSAQAFTQLNLAMEDMKRPASDTIDMLIGLQAAGTVAGQSAGDVKESIRQLGQAFGKGKLDGDELRSIAERMPRFLREIQKEMGVTTAQFFDMSSKGKLTPEALTDPFLKVSKRFFDEMLRMPVSMSRAFTILGLVTQRFSADLDRALGLSKAISASIQFLSRTIEGMRGGLSVIADFVRDLGGLKDVAQLVGIALLVAFGSSILTAFFKLKLAIDLIAAAFGRVLLPLALVVLATLAIEDFVGWIEGKDSVFGRIFGDFDKVIEPIKPQLEALRSWIEKNLDIGDVVKNSIRELNFFLKWFDEHQELNLFKNYQREYENIKKFVIDLINLFTPLGKFFDDLFAGINKAIEDFVNWFDTKVKSIGNTIKWLIGLIPGLSSADAKPADGASTAGPGAGVTGGTMDSPPERNSPFITGGTMEDISKVLKSVPPIPDVAGKVGSTTNNNTASQSNSINNNVTINAPAADPASIASGVNSGMGQATEGMITRLGNSMALGLGISSPRVEAPAMP